MLINFTNIVITIQFRFIQFFILINHLLIIASINKQFISFFNFIIDFNQFRLLIVYFNITMFDVKFNFNEKYIVTNRNVHFKSKFEFNSFETFELIFDRMRLFTLKTIFKIYKYAIKNLFLFYDQNALIKFNCAKIFLNFINN